MVETSVTPARAIEPPRSILRGGSMRSERWALVALVAACIASRLVTTIYHVEDLDSLHFALSMVEFDVARLQPHFPGYVVFVGLARLFSAISGSIAVGFALVGATATALLTLGLLRLARTPLASRAGVIVATLTIGGGMLWLYANRYMPDLLGTALLVWALDDLTADSDRRRVRGALAAALLAGTRLSYLPFLLPVAIYALVRWRSARLAAIGAAVVGVLLWAVPLVALTGWDELLAIAANQTAGHFDEFGGTIRTEPNVALRLERILSGVWTDLLGGWVPGRGALTVATGLASLVGVAAAMPRAARALRSNRWRLVVAGAASYLAWIFLYQNVIHHTRHLLPLAPLATLAIAVGFASLARRGRVATCLVVAMALALCGLGASLAWQHRRPSAIAQTSRTLAEEHAPLVVVSTALVNYYLESTGVRARFLAVDREGTADSLARALAEMPAHGALVSVGDYRAQVPLPTTGVRRFYHNPYVNRIWPQVELYSFEIGGAR